MIPRAYNTQLYPKDLGAAISTRRIYDPDYAVLSDPDIYDKLRKYAPIDGAIDLRKRMVAGSDWFLEAASSSTGDRAAVPIFTALIQQLQAFETARYHLSEALIKGSAWAEMVGEWRIVEIPPLPPKLWFVITAFRDMDKRRFCLIRDDDQRPGEARWHVEAVVPPFETRAIEREHYVRVAYGTDEASLGYGRGLAESLLYPFWFATSNDEHANQFGEKWAQGFRIWKVGAEGPLLTNDKIQKYLNVVDTFVSRYAAVVGKDSEFELVDAPAESLKYITERQNYYNALLRTRILGSSLMTDPQVEGGSFALGESQDANTTQLMVHHDRGVLDEGITHDFVGLLWRVNFQQLLELGIRTTGPPKYHTRDLKQKDPAKRIPVIESATKVGLKVSESEVYADYNLTPPAPGEPVLEPPEPITAGPGRPPEPGKDKQPETPSRQKLELEERALRIARLEGELAQLRATPPSVHITNPAAPRDTRLEAAPAAPSIVVHNHVPVQPPVVVPAPNVDVSVEAAAPVVVPAPDVTVQAAAPIVVPAPQVHVAAAAPAQPQVVVAPLREEAEKKVTIERDNYGRITGASVKPKE